MAAPFGSRKWRLAGHAGKQNAPRVSATHRAEHLRRAVKRELVLPPAARLVDPAILPACGSDLLPNELCARLAIMALAVIIHAPAKLTEV